jgi:hypothetical protein
MRCAAALSTAGDELGCVIIPIGADRATGLGFTQRKSVTVNLAV